MIRRREFNEERASQTLSRRQILDWLGKSAVVSLSAPWLLRCTSGDDLPMDTSTVTPSSNMCDTPLGFSPPEDEPDVFAGWPVRTVDAQNIQDILKTWTLRVDGLVKNPILFDFAQLIGLERQNQITDFHCVEGWSVFDVPWNGIHLGNLFDIVEPLKEATHVTFHTIGDKYNESLPMDVALEPKTLLAYGVDCRTLPLDHGFPVRLVVPRKYAYKSAKYVYRIELDDKPISGFWVAYGYPYDADVTPTRLREGKY